MIDGVTRATCQMLYGAAVNCITYYCQFNTRANFMIPYDRIPSCRFTLHFTPIYTSTRRHVLQVCERHRSHKVFVSRVQTLAQSAKNEMAQICTGTGKHRHYLNIFRAVKASEMVKSLAATRATLHPILSERSFCSNRCTQSRQTAQWLCFLLIRLRILRCPVDMHALCIRVIQARLALSVGHA